MVGAEGATRRVECSARRRQRRGEAGDVVRVRVLGPEKGTGKESRGG